MIQPKQTVATDARGQQQNKCRLTGDGGLDPMSDNGGISAAPDNGFNVADRNTNNTDTEPTINKIPDQVLSRSD